MNEIEKGLFAPCGLDCAKCEARIATINNDDVLKKAVAERWSELNHILITPEMINCLGCLQNGAKTTYCEKICPIRPCAQKKGYCSCSECSSYQGCQLLAPILSSSHQARKNLEKMASKINVCEHISIGGIPSLLYGPKSAKGFLFIHGQGGNKEEAEAFAKIAVPAGYQVLSIDLPQHGERKDMANGFDPWTVVPELEAVLAEQKKHWSNISLRANSIGAYFSMLAFQHEQIHRALFVSPIVDMEQLIMNMMDWAGVNEETLHVQGEIPTDFGQTLSWSYLCWVRQHPLINWKTPTFVLYAGHDNLTSYQTIAAFSRKYDAELTVYDEGEHWFHTPEQLERLEAWEKQSLRIRR